MQTDSKTLNSSLQEFFVNCLQEMYWSEVNMRNSISTMMEEASSEELRQAFQEHAGQTDTHVKTLENVFAQLGIQPEAKPSVGLQGLFDEGWKVIDQTQKGSSQRDVALIIAAQKIEHYEIASYGSMITLAETLGHKEIAQMLEPVLQEEKETDARLSSIARSGINVEASQEPAPSM